jgi:hypothetical protein
MQNASSLGFRVYVAVNFCKCRVSQVSPYVQMEPHVIALRMRAVCLGALHAAGMSLAPLLLTKKLKRLKVSTSNYPV